MTTTAPTTPFNLDARIASMARALKAQRRREALAAWTKHQAGRATAICQFRVLLEADLPPAMRDALGVRIVTDEKCVSRAAFVDDEHRWAIKQGGSGWEIERPYLTTNLNYRAPSGQLVGLLLANLAVAREEHATKRRVEAEQRADREAVWAREAAAKAVVIAEADEVHSRLKAVVDAAVAEAKATAWTWPVVDGEPRPLTLYHISWLTGMSHGEDGIAYADREEGWSTSRFAQGGWRVIYQTQYAKGRVRKLELGAEHLVIVEERTFCSLTDLPGDLRTTAGVAVPGVAYESSRLDDQMRYVEWEGHSYWRELGLTAVPWVRELLAVPAEVAF